LGVFPTWGKSGGREELTAATYITKKNAASQKWDYHFRDVGNWLPEVVGGGRKTNPTRKE